MRRLSLYKFLVSIVVKLYDIGTEKKYRITLQQCGGFNFQAPPDAVESNPIRDMSAANDLEA